MKKLFIVVGARPNFMKIAPIIRAIEKYNDVEYKLIHTGQHYDDNMSEVFFKELEIPEPDYNFGVGSMSHANQTAMIMTLFEAYCLDEKPDVVLVAGDVNSTLACAMVVSKLEGVELAHVEAGERSFDKRMPEEINRIVTDVLSDYLFCTTDRAVNNLLNEGLDKNKIYLVGNVMIDTLLHNISKVRARKDNGSYILCTIHRQSNTDNKENLENILKALDYISKDIEIVFPIHPRTVNRIKAFDFSKYLKHVKIFEPLSYMDFLYNMKHASLVLTDSGSIQVETTVLNVPCLTVRENTEWMFTLNEGTNKLINMKDADQIIDGVHDMLDRPMKSNLSKSNKKLLDGRAAERIVKILVKEQLDEQKPIN